MSPETSHVPPAWAQVEFPATPPPPSSTSSSSSFPFPLFIISFFAPLFGAFRLPIGVAAMMDEAIL